MLRSSFILLGFLCSLQFTNAQGNYQLMERLHIQRNQQLDPMMDISSHSLYPAVAGIPAALWLVGHYQQKDALKKHSYHLGSALAFTSFFTLAAKNSIRRPRPYESYPTIQNLNYSPTPSFPSGHSALSFSLATSLALEFPRWYIIAPAYAWAGLTSYSRIHNGVHYPGDVLAGAATGTLCAYLNYRLQDWIHGK